MMNTKDDTAIAIRDQIVRQQDKVTRIVGDITPGSLDTLEEEIGSVLVAIKSYHFKGGWEYVHLAIIALEQEYRDVIRDNNWDYKPPEDMLVYDPDAVNLDNAKRSQAEAIWRRKETALKAFNGACNGENN